MLALDMIWEQLSIAATANLWPGPMLSVLTLSIAEVESTKTVQPRPLDCCGKSSIAGTIMTAKMSASRGRLACRNFALVLLREGLFLVCGRQLDGLQTECA